MTPSDPKPKPRANPRARSAAPVVLKVSVVVPVFNASAYILGLIESLSRQTLPAGEFEVVVVDDGSTDGTAELVETQVRVRSINMSLLRMEQNSGPAAARNAGIAATTAKIVAFTDADCEPDPDWLERGLIHLRDEVVDAVEGRTEPKGKPGPLTHQMINHTGGLFMTCNMFYRRDVLEEVGGFDERFRVAFLEDSDLAFALLERQGEIRWAPDVVVRHLVLEAGPQRFVKDARKRFWNPLLLKKHPSHYRTHILPVVPGLPPLHLKYMGAIIMFPLPIFAGLPGFSVPIAVMIALFGRRVAHAYKARTPALAVRALALPFVQTFHVLRGAIAWRCFSWRL